LVPHGPATISSRTGVYRPLQ